MDDGEATLDFEGFADRGGGVVDKGAEDESCGHDSGFDGVFLEVSVGGREGVKERGEGDGDVWACFSNCRNAPPFDFFRFLFSF